MQDLASLQTQTPPLTVSIAEPAPAPSSEDQAAGLPDGLPDEPGAQLAQQPTVDVAAANAPSGGASKAAVDSEDQSTDGHQTKRILYIVPNFGAVSVDSQPPPQTVKEKFITAAQDSVDYSAFIFFAFQAGFGMISNSYPEFHQGLAGYGRYYWHDFADGADENLWVEFLFPAALRQDTRYYTLGKGGFVKRFTYAFSRVVVTRTDEGHQAFNASEILGAGSAAAISNFYYPSQERTEVKTYQRWVTNVIVDGGTFVFKEFWPDINKTFFHQKD
jgi:hypothetical protein